MKMNLSTKIISLFVLGGVIPMVAIGILSYRSSSKALEQQAFNQLISVRSTKKVNIEDWFNERKANCSQIAESLLTINAIKELKTAFRESGAEKVRDMYITNNPFPSRQVKSWNILMQKTAAPTVVCMPSIIPSIRTFSNNMRITIFFL